MSEAPIHLSRTLKADTLRQAAKVEEQGCTVFLGGPYVDPTNETSSTYSSSAQLRYHLFHRLQAQGWSVSLGEYKDLIDAHGGILGPHNNAAAAEIAHASEVADAVIMIVDSPGSFAEIGAFSMVELICGKMLVLSDKKYEGSHGYVATGPILLSKAFGASIEYFDFTDIDTIALFVCSHIEKHVQLRSLRQIVKR